VIRDLRGRGVFVFIYSPPTYSGAPPMPDVYATAGGVGSFWLETKRAANIKAKDAQVVIINRLRRAGTPAYVIKTWEQYVQVINIILTGKADLTPNVRP